MTEKQLNKFFEKIAKEELFIETFETRKMDSLDFHDVAVWGVKKVLEKAYLKGLVEGKKKSFTTVDFKGFTASDEN